MSQDVSESGKKHHTVRAGRDAVSAVQLPQSLTAAIDQWAEARQINRSDAIRQLVELGLRASPVTASHARHDVLEIEGEAISLLRKLLDPVLPIEERERRIRRLIEGPPEFSEQRVDLPERKK